MSVSGGLRGGQRGRRGETGRGGWERGGEPRKDLLSTYVCNLMCLLMSHSQVRVFEYSMYGICFLCAIIHRLQNLLEARKSFFERYANYGCTKTEST